MRPEIIFPLFAPTTSLSGVGAKIAKLLHDLCGDKVIDLLWHRPANIVDRRRFPYIASVPEGMVATLKVTVTEHQPPHNKKSPYRVICYDKSSELILSFFHAHQDYINKKLPEGREVLVSGKIERFGRSTQMAHPDYIVFPEQEAEIPEIEPIYPLKAGISGKILQKFMAEALDRLPDFPEWLDAAHQKRERWEGVKPALLRLHHPQDISDISPNNPARRRLAYDELLAGQLALALMREKTRNLAGRSIKDEQGLARKIALALPYKLTSAQKRVVAEIIKDMESTGRMLRLLQGDVGSGKTVVALLAAASAIGAGTQAAIMAPTDILARQHFASLEKLAEVSGIKIALLTGRSKGKPRETLLNELKEGNIDLLIGTHALFQEDVEFKDLGLAIIDEQHRFGVEQRLALTAKGKGLDVLVMTATPIPRTLALAFYGDMEVSKLDEMPPGRKAIETRVLPQERIDDVVNALKRSFSHGEQAFWVCPLVAESEKLDLAAAEERHAALSRVFGDKVGLVHGKMKAAEKDATMENFLRGELSLLVATTVIEVGVNVPNATVMVIEHAERFGLAQLHQLRGRIGRGDKASSCLMIYSSPLSETARSRLKVMRETEDGFKIAEEDLRLRGIGEVLGTRQSGAPEFKIAELPFDEELLATARDDAKLIISNDPKLESSRGKNLRTLLYLFEQDAAVKTLLSG